MKRLTIFTWGYYGWGNHTTQLVKAVDAVEASRGFEPPIFVDVRIRRTVRAIGFQGTNFEKLLGPKRHRWMKELGNGFDVKKRTGPRHPNRRSLRLPKGLTRIGPWSRGEGETAGFVLL